MQDAAGAIFTVVSCLRNSIKKKENNMIRQLSTILTTVLFSLFLSLSAHAQAPLRIGTILSVTQAPHQSGDVLDFM